MRELTFASQECSEIIDELFTGDARLFQNSAKRANGQFWVQRYNAAADAVGTLAFQHNMTAALSDSNKAQPLKKRELLLTLKRGAV
jgi:hypothetical protein